MVEMLQEKLEGIADLCARYGVARLDVFGSALRDNFKLGESDIDFLVKFHASDAYARADAYFGFLDELRALLGVSVDLVVSGAVRNRFVAADIERTKKVLNAA